MVGENSSTVANGSTQEELIQELNSGKQPPSTRRAPRRKTPASSTMDTDSVLYRNEDGQHQERANSGNQQLNSRTHESNNGEQNGQTSQHRPSGKHKSRPRHGQNEELSDTKRTNDRDHQTNEGRQEEEILGQNQAYSGDVQIQTPEISVASFNDREQKRSGLQDDANLNYQVNNENKGEKFLQPDRTQLKEESTQRNETTDGPQLEDYQTVQRQDEGEIKYNSVDTEQKTKCNENPNEKGPKDSTGNEHQNRHGSIHEQHSASLFVKRKLGDGYLEPSSHISEIIPPGEGDEQFPPRKRVENQIVDGFNPARKMTLNNGGKILSSTTKGMDTITSVGKGVGDQLSDQINSVGKTVTTTSGVNKDLSNGINALGQNAQTAGVDIQNNISDGFNSLSETAASIIGTSEKEISDGTKLAGETLITEGTTDQSSGIYSAGGETGTKELNNLNAEGGNTEVSKGTGGILRQPPGGSTQNKPVGKPIPIGIFSGYNDFYW